MLDLQIQRHLYRSFRPYIIFVLLLTCKVLAYSQTYSGDIRGSITDPSGAAIPKASITLTDEATHQTRNTSTDSA
jgi:hypothetical protein